MAEATMYDDDRLMTGRYVRLGAEALATKGLSIEISSPDQSVATDVSTDSPVKRRMSACAPTENARGIVKLLLYDATVSSTVCVSE